MPHRWLHTSEDGIEKDEIDQVDRIEKDKIDQVLKLLPSHSALSPDGFNIDFHQKVLANHLPRFLLPMQCFL
jgi:hypothetical protein